MEKRQNSDFETILKWAVFIREGFTHKTLPITGSFRFKEHANLWRRNWTIKNDGDGNSECWRGINFREILQEAFRQLGQILALMDPCFWCLTRYRTPEERGIPLHSFENPKPGGFSQFLMKLMQALEGLSEHGKSTYGRADSKNSFFVHAGIANICWNSFVAIRSTEISL